MKILKKLLICLCVALIVQQSVFIYIENVYLGANSDIKVEKLEEKEIKKDISTEVSIDEAAEKIAISSNGKYISYMVNNQLKIEDSSDGNVKNAESKDIVFYKWITNQNYLIAIEKIKYYGSYYFKPISIEAKTGEARELSDFSLENIKIELDNEKDKIDDVIFSTGTHSLYIKVGKSNGKSDLYYANVMNELKKVRQNKHIDDIVVPLSKSKAVMEMDSKITILDSPNNISVAGVKKAEILGTDNNDYVYFGEVKDNKVVRIYYSEVNEGKEKWQSLNLIKPVNEEDIFIDYYGKVYVNDKEEKKVLELTTNQTITYKGELIQIYNKGMVTKDDNKIIKLEV